jgi:hypothetical protein
MPSVTIDIHGKSGTEKYVQCEVTEQLDATNTVGGTGKCR